MITTFSHDTDMAELFGIDGLTYEEQADMLGGIGEVLLDSALVRLVETVTDEELDEIEQQREQLSSESFWDWLRGNEKFAAILQDELVSFRMDATAVLQDPTVV